MKTLEKKGAGVNSRMGQVISDNSLNDRPISKAELRKVEEAREFLKKHPIPEHLLRR
jgi:hypothetical protein